MANKFKLAIFDMDGLLIDSEIHWIKLDKEFWPQLGVDNLGNFQKDILGLKLDDIYKVVKAKYNPKLSITKARQMHARYGKIIYSEKADLLKGAKILLKKLKISGIKSRSSAILSWRLFSLDKA